MAYIYRIWNIQNNKSYIGQSIYNPLGNRGRIERHLRGWAVGCLALHNSIKKYGRDNFCYEILHADIPKFALDALEVATIQAYNTLHPHGYNLTEGGGGVPATPEIKSKISEGLRGKTISAEARKKIGRANKGRKHTDETKRKISESISQLRKDKPLSVETRKKISETLKNHNHRKGYTHSPETRKKMSKSRRKRGITDEQRRKTSESIKKWHAERTIKRSHAWIFESEMKYHYNTGWSMSKIAQVYRCTPRTVKKILMS